MFRLPVLLLNSMSKLIHNQCTCKLNIKTLRLHTCVQTNNCVFVLCFNPFFSIVQLWNYTKTIIRLRLSKYSLRLRGIIVKYQLQEIISQYFKKLAFTQVLWLHGSNLRITDRCGILLLLTKRIRCFQPLC